MIGGRWHFSLLPHPFRCDLLHSLDVEESHNHPLPAQTCRDRQETQCCRSPVPLILSLQHTCELEVGIPDFGRMWICVWGALYVDNVLQMYQNYCDLKLTQI